MLPRLDRSDRKLIGQLAAIAALSVVAVAAAGRYAENVFMETESDIHSAHVVGFLRYNLSDLPAILAHGQVTEQDRAVFRNATRLGGVFRYKLFSPEGLVVFSSDPEAIGKQITEPYFDTVVRQGQSFFRVTHKPVGGFRADELGVPYGEGIRLVGERYVPIMDGSRFLGAIEVYLDMTPLSERLHRVGLGLLGGLLALLAIVSLICGAFLSRNIKERRRRIEEIEAARRRAESLAHQANTMLKSLLVAEEEKMNRVVGLVGGIAHEIGNPLATLNMGLDALEASLREASCADCDARITNMREALARVGGFVHRFNELSPMEGESDVEIDVNGLTRSLTGLVQLDDRARKAVFALKISPDTASLSLPRQSLSLALFIILSVAAENIDDAGRRIEIETRNSTTEGWVRLRIVASNLVPAGSPGAASATLPRESDHPALDTARRIIESMGGRMTVSTQTSGAKVCDLDLPRAPQPRGSEEDIIREQDDHPGCGAGAG